MEAAIAVRDSLRGTLLHTVSLITALKRQKKQSLLVKSTLDSLKQLQSVAKLGANSTWVMLSRDARLIKPLRFLNNLPH